MTNPLNKQAQFLVNNLSSGIKFKLWALKNLPSVFFWGISIKELNADICSVRIPFGWRSQNPFKSIYFAALAGAAELSTGALALLSMAGKGKYSMLVTDFKAEYSKKANTHTLFTCANGPEFFSTIDSLKNSGDSGVVQAVSIGRNLQGEEVAKIYVTWSFKKK